MSRWIRAIKSYWYTKKPGQNMIFNDRGSGSGKNRNWYLDTCWVPPYSGGGWLRRWPGLGSRPAWLKKESLHGGSLFESCASSTVYVRLYTLVQYNNRKLTVEGICFSGQTNILYSKKNFLLGITLKGLCHDNFYLYYFLDSNPYGNLK